MSGVDAVVGYLLVALIAFIAGTVIGERRGIRDTEERWSDAVGRAEDERRRERSDLYDRGFQAGCRKGKQS